MVALEYVWWKKQDVNKKKNPSPQPPTQTFNSGGTNHWHELKGDG